LSFFLAATFLITWGCWWALVPLTRGGTLAFGQPLFMTLYLLGGFGPTIAAYLAVLATSDEGTVREFHGRLFRWRVGIAWYVVAFGLPFAVALGSVALTGLIEPGFPDRLKVQPLGQLVPLFLTMIIGGGLEELGWRGVAQPELERRTSRAAAATIIGVVWAAWHLPLFSIPGVGQYGTSFPIYAIGVIGSAFILAWLYAETGSIFLCLLFHAAINTAAAMGLVIPTDLVGPAVADGVLKLLVGAGLVFATRRRLQVTGDERTRPR
jgi:membrane protease YdiL (CAAX protease family)